MVPGIHEFRILIQNFLLIPCLLSVVFCRHRSQFFSEPKILGVVVAYLFYMASVSFFRTHDAAFFQWALYILLLLFGISTAMNLQWQTLVKLLLATVVVAAFSIVYATVKDWAILRQLGYRMTGYGGLYNPLRSGHVWGFFVVIGVFLCSYARQWLGRGLAPCIAATIVCFAGVLMSGSRSPLFGILTSCACALLVTPKPEVRKLLLSIMASMAVPIIALGSEFSDRGLSFRPEIWAKAIELTMPHPWLGCGLGCGVEILTPSGLSVIEPHNNLISAFYFGGLFGLALFLATFAVALQMQWRISRTSPMALLALVLQVFGLTTLLFDGGGLIGRPSEFWLLYWLPVALILRSRVHSAGRGSPNNIAIGAQ